jgi:hypothetical protein
LHAAATARSMAGIAFEDWKGTMPNAETGPGGHGFDSTPELLEDMTPRDLVFVLQCLQFRKDDSTLIRLDKGTRDYLVRALTERRH